MDDYPNCLAPKFEESGAVATPFSTWWKRTNSAFPNVPEKVAEQWLHRHWGQSEFGWLPSSSYEFSEKKYPLSILAEIRTTWSDFKNDNRPALDQGKFICGAHPTRQWPHGDIWLVKYMRDNRTFPVPIIVLDNHDGHLKRVKGAPNWAKVLPSALILIEGHTRLNVGLYLSSIDELNEPIELFIMKKKE
jgi:hypothetical protein